MRRLPQRGTPDFCHPLVLPDIFNRSNFEYNTFSGLKVDSGKRKRKKKKQKSKKEDAKEEN